MKVEYVSIRNQMTDVRCNSRWTGNIIPTSCSAFVHQTFETLLYLRNKTSNTFMYMNCLNLIVFIKSTPSDVLDSAVFKIGILLIKIE